MAKGCSPKIGGVSPAPCMKQVHQPDPWPIPFQLGSQCISAESPQLSIVFSTILAYWKVPVSWTYITSHMVLLVHKLTYTLPSHWHNCVRMPVPKTIQANNPSYAFVTPEVGDKSVVWFEQTQDRWTIRTNSNIYDKSPISLNRVSLRCSDILLDFLVNTCLLIVKVCLN